MNQGEAPGPDIATFPDLAGFLEVLQQLVREPSVVGTEDSFFRVLRRELEEFDVRVDRHLGVLVARGRSPESLVLSAHIDRHGLLCTGPNEFQYAAFIAGNRGELDGDSVSEQTMATIADRFTGQRVQAHLPFTGTYLGQGVIFSGRMCPHRRNLIFEIDGLDYLHPGTPVSFLDRLRVTPETLSAQLDNVLSVAIIIHLFRLVAATGDHMTGTTLQIPTTAYHTASETATLRSVGASLRLLSSYL